MQLSINSYVMLQVFQVLAVNLEYKNKDVTVSSIDVILLRCTENTKTITIERLDYVVVADYFKVLCFRLQKATSFVNMFTWQVALIAFGGAYLT